MRRHYGHLLFHLVSLLVLLAILVGCGSAARPTATPAPADDPATAQPAANPPTGAPAPTAAASGQPAPPAAPTMTAPPPATDPTAKPTPPPGAGAAPTPPTNAPTADLPPSNGPLVKNRLVTYYGHPYSDKMGVLGEFDDPQQRVDTLKEQAAAYTAADPSRPAIPTIELIASVAQGSPGPNNLWLYRTPPDVIEQYAQLAEKNNCLLLLDVQMGYDTVAHEVQALLPYLRRPYVHLAIDPEFHVKPGQVPGEEFGSVSAADINGAAATLADLVVRYNIPDKVLVIHQFRDDMLPDKQNIKPIPHIQMVIVMDGWGTPDAKLTNYKAFIHDQPIQYGGIKIFYRQDTPLLTPEQVVQLDPAPLVVIYQ
ncbi:MAG: hypothetical protein ACTHMA_08205 [Thermomicrobiales bacterium]